MPFRAAGMSAGARRHGLPRCPAGRAAALELPRRLRTTICCGIYGHSNKKLWTNGRRSCGEGQPEIVSLCESGRGFETRRTGGLVFPWKNRGRQLAAGLAVAETDAPQSRCHGTDAGTSPGCAVSAAQPGPVPTPRNPARTATPADAARRPGSRSAPRRGSNRVRGNAHAAVNSRYPDVYRSRRTRDQSNSGPGSNLRCGATSLWPRAQRIG